MQPFQPLGGGRKRKSDQMSVDGGDHYGADTASQTIPTKGGSPHPEESPFKRQRVGITLAQKQALIDNLQLELTERARKLRANYNIHAQSLRTRIEIRVNRIPLSLRRLTMGELLDKCSQEQEQQKPGATASATNTARGPPVPAKDKAPSRPPSRPPTRGAMAPPSGRPVKRLSHEITGTSGDKENDMQTPQKKMRANTVSDMSRNAASHVLSPTTSNSRVGPRPTTAAGSSSTTTTTSTTAATPARSGIIRPAVTPGRATTAASSTLNKMVDGSRSVRGGAPTPARKTLTTTSTSTTAAAAAAAAAAARRKRGATVSAATSSTRAAAAAPPRPTTAASATRRASGASESSDASSTGTVVRRRQQPQAPRPMTAPPGGRPGTAAGGRKAAPVGGAGAAGKKAGAGTGTGTGSVKGGGTGTGRVLRKRG